MTIKCLGIEEFDLLASELNQQLPSDYIRYIRHIRPTLLDTIGPDRYRQLFKITEVMRVAYQVAQEKEVSLRALCNLENE